MKTFRFGHSITIFVECMISLFSLLGCDGGGGNAGGESNGSNGSAGSKEMIIAADPDPSKGFYWPYHLFVPENPSEPLPLLIEPVSTSTAEWVDLDQDYGAIIADEDARSNAETIFDRFSDLKLSILVPWFPGLVGSDWGDGFFYPIHLERDTFLVDDERLKRLDLQLIAMIDDASARLSSLGIELQEDVLLNGFSSTGIFVNRFVHLHPDQVLAAAIGAPGVYQMPVSTWQDETVSYPVGISNLAELTGEAFDLEGFQATPLFIYIGREDTNDPVGLEEDEDEEQIQRLFGSDLITRFNSAKSVYESVDSNSHFKIYEGVGHQLTDEMIADVKEFFLGSLPESLPPENVRRFISGG